ncbi:MAG: hypothetical protein NTY19_06620 [Planctomycetota bacterium]|nr:hypothetical protein [Planctomycetota bacterium]
MAAPAHQCSVRKQRFDHHRHQRQRQLLFERLEARRVLSGLTETSFGNLAVDPGVPTATGPPVVEIAKHVSSELLGVGAVTASSSASQLAAVTVRLIASAALTDSGHSDLSNLYTKPLTQSGLTPDQTLALSLAQGGISSAMFAPKSAAPGSVQVVTPFGPTTLDEMQGLGSSGNASTAAPRSAAPVLITPPPVSGSTGTASANPNWAISTDLAARLGLTLPPADVSVAAGSLSPSSALAVQESGDAATPINVVHVGWLDSPAETPGGALLSAPAVDDLSSPLTETEPILPGPLADTVLQTVGFEPIDGFSTGFIGTQGGWSTFSNTTTEPVISSVHPSTGSQHLRIAAHAGLAQDTLVGAFSPSLGRQVAGHCVVSVDAAVSASGGADYYVVAQSNSQGELTAELDLSYDGHIWIRDNTGSGLQWYDSGVAWTTGGYETVTIDVDASANTINYSYGGSRIYTGVVWGATSVEQVILFGDNCNAVDVGDFDNVSIRSLSPPQPDLVNARLGNWNDFIPIDVTQHAAAAPHACDGPYYSNQTLHFNWLSWNPGIGPACNYTIVAQVTGQGGGTYQWTDLNSVANASTDLTNDQSVEPLVAGAHTFRIWLDYGDMVAEADELSNYYERTITVLPAGALNQGLAAALIITGPGGVLAANDAAISGIRDAAVVSVTVPTTGRYLFKVGSQNLNTGSYTLEAGIYDASVPTETGDTTNLDPLRAANGNVAVLRYGDGIGQQDLYTITLNAGEAVNIAGSTPSGFYFPQVLVTGPGGFDPGLPSPGPNFDTVQMFTAPTTGTYTITVAYPLSSNHVDVVSIGSYVVTISLSDTAANDSLADARPISTFDYRQPTPATSWYYGATGNEGMWRGTIAPAGEAHYFGRGHLAAGQLIRVAVQREGASEVFPLMVLANSSGQIITGGNPFRSPGLEGFAFFETIVSQADDYYAVVFGDATVAGGTTDSGGAYDLFYADFRSTEDVYEQNDSKAQVDAATAV